jgi:TrmH family RNA methyltransferase
MITSRQNALVRHFRKLGTDGGYRADTGEFICDGDKLLRDAVHSDTEIIRILTDSEAVAAEYGDAAELVTGDILDYVSPLKSARTVVFSCKIPVVSAPGALPPKCVVLEDMQDPGNVGTIIRTANAFGAPYVVLAGDCADPFGVKAARASMGAVFRQRILRVGRADIGAFARRGCKFLGAALNAASHSINEINFEDFSVIIGNEGNGLSTEIVQYCSGTFIIPMRDGTDSLNAASAAAIILWEMMK